MTGGCKRIILIFLAAAFGVVVTCSVFYPGVMSPDSVGSYRDATTNVINGSSQVPILAFLWKYILKVIPSPFGPLLFQNLIFWSGLALVVSACRLSARGSVLVVLGVGFFPTVFALLGVLWKDIL